MGIEYTVSSRYLKIADGITLVNKNKIEAWDYRPPQTPGAIQWVNEHIIHRSAQHSYPDLQGWRPGTIVEGSYGFPGQTGIGSDKQGYPDLSFLGRITSDVVEEQMLAGGCPATWCTYSLLVGVRIRLRFYRLYIKPRDQPVIYSFDAYDFVANPTGAETEMIRIRDSIHVVKAR
jgi:hypothetical protein